jgi:hypothetical protein
LFTRQSKVFFAKGIDREASCGSDEFIRQLHELSRLLHKIDEATEKQIPFLIVVPNAIVPISKQMELLEYSDNKGETDLHDAGFRSLYLGACTDRLYLAYHVRSASDFLGTSFDFSRDVLERGRFGLTAEEGIALACYNPPDMFLGFPRNLVGSRYGESNEVPYLFDRMLVDSAGPGLAAWPESKKTHIASVFPECAGRLS